MKSKHLTMGLFIVNSILLLLILTSCGGKDSSKKVVFYDGNSVYQTTETVDGLVTLPNISKKGYEFDGWFTDEALTVTFDF